MKKNIASTRYAAIAALFLTFSLKGYAQEHSSQASVQSSAQVQQPGKSGVLPGINSTDKSPSTPVAEAKKLQVELKLSDLQTKKITAMLTPIADKEEQAKMKIWQTTNNKNAIMGYIIQQTETNELKIGKVLTIEQQKKFREIVNKRLATLKYLAVSQE